MHTQETSMPKLSRADLMTLEAYAKARPEMRAQVLEHKKNRTITLGEHVTLIFEDTLTIRYQIQEMLRVERIFEEAGIQDELDAYNPLIPDGANWKASMLIEYTDVVERQSMLARLKDIEHRVWVQAVGQTKIYAIADEDMERANEEKTSAVHFLRFELDPATVGAIKAGAAIAMGISHPEYTALIPALPAASRDALAQDLA
jgi:hypothetical protein